MSEPVETPAEPVEDEVIEAEPVEGETEPASEDSNIEVGDDAPEENETFMDLKSVPKELTPAAKKIQAELTKRSQALAEREREIADRESRIKEAIGGTSEDPTVQEAQEFFGTPQGQAMKNVLLNEIANELGINELRQESFSNKANMEIDQAIAKYGKEALEAHADEIDAIMEQNPTIPLDYILANVLYGNAKESGKQELNQKLQEKKAGSLPSGGTSNNTTPSKEIKSFRDAFEVAEQGIK